MDCNKMEEIILTGYMDGELTGGALKDVEAHLTSCSRCRGLASELKSVSAEFKKSGREDPPSEVWERIRSEVSRTPAAAVFAQEFFRSARLIFVRLRPAIAITTAVALILVVLVAGRLMPYRGTVNTPAGEDEILLMAALDENGITDYDFGTPEENYFL